MRHAECRGRCMHAPCRILHCASRSSPPRLERLPETDVQRRKALATAADLLGVNLEAQVHANWADRGPVPQPEPDGASQLGEIDVHRAAEDIAGIKKPDNADAASNGGAHFG